MDAFELLIPLRRKSRIEMIPNKAGKCYQIYIWAFWLADYSEWVIYLRHEERRRMIPYMWVQTRTTPLGSRKRLLLLPHLRASPHTLFSVHYRVHIWILHGYLYEWCFILILPSWNQRFQAFFHWKSHRLDEIPYLVDGMLFRGFYWFDAFQWFFSRPCYFRMIEDCWMNPQSCENKNK